MLLKPHTKVGMSGQWVVFLSDVFLYPYTIEEMLFTKFHTLLVNTFCSVCPFGISSKTLTMGTFIMDVLVNPYTIVGPPLSWHCVDGKHILKLPLGI